MRDLMPGRLAAVAALILAGCGGGGGSSGGAAVQAVPAPTPSASPSATPSPSATVDPASYQLAFDPAADRGFALVGAELASTGAQTSGGFVYSAATTRLFDPAALAVARYVAATRTTSILLAGREEVYTGPSFQRADQIVYGSAGGVVPDRYLAYLQPGQELGGLPSNLRYTVLFSQRTRIPGAASTDLVDRLFVGGTPTVDADLPRTGTVGFATFMSGQRVVTGTASFTTGLTRQSGDVSIDFAGRTLSAAIVTTSGNSAAPDPVVTLRLSGALVGDTGQLAGTLTTSDGGSGRWVGRLNGPAARELALALTYAVGNERVIGTVQAVRP